MNDWMNSLGDVTFTVVAAALAASAVIVGVLATYGLMQWVS